jgi:hypothetical protein
VAEVRYTTPTGRADSIPSTTWRSIVLFRVKRYRGQQADRQGQRDSRAIILAPRNSSPDGLRERVLVRFPERFPVRQRSPLAFGSQVALEEVDQFRNLRNALRLIEVELARDVPRAQPLCNSLQQVLEVIRTLVDAKQDALRHTCQRAVTGPKLLLARPSRIGLRDTRLHHLPRCFGKRRPRRLRWCIGG